MSTYLLIDLENQTTTKGTLQEGLTDLLEMQQWQEDPSFVALASGMLTGSGAPGTGTMLWFYQDETKECKTAEMYQGKISSVLRYCGYDFLLLKGKAKSACAYVDIQDETISFSDQETIEKQKTKVSFEDDGVWENAYFAVGTSALSARLKEKGVKAIYVKSNGGMKIAEPEKFLGLCEKLCTAYSCDLEEAEGKAAYLSVVKNFEKSALSALLGVAWSSETEMLKTAEELLDAFSEEKLEESQILQRAERINAMIQMKEGGGA